MLTKEEFTNGLADDIRIRLNASGMTQSDLAEQTGLTKATISRYIHGQRTPGTYEYYKIMEVLK